MISDHFYLLPLFVITYMVAVDKNLSEYLFLRLVKQPMVGISSAVLKYKLLAQLNYDRFLIKRGVVPKRFYDMASSIRDSTDQTK